jgi:DNA-binding transcriptional regulator of glucitol operon
MHVTLLVLLPLFAWLTWWQYTRAEHGNTLSWAYVVLWPAFAAYAVYTWWQLIHDQAARVPGRAPATAPAAGTGSDVPASVDPDP